jgi:hypothetical protein
VTLLVLLLVVLVVPYYTLLFFPGFLEFRLGLRVGVRVRHANFRVKLNDELEAPSPSRLKPGPQAELHWQVPTRSQLSLPVALPVQSTST